MNFLPIFFHRIVRPEFELPEWEALPGNRLELGTLGFAIEMNLRSPFEPTFALYDPEGRCIAKAMRTAPLKDLGQALAMERAEFLP